MSWLYNLSIRKQLLAIVAIMIISIIGIEVFSVIKLKKAIYDDRKLMTQQIVELVHGVLVSQKSAVDRGELTEAEAKEKSLNLIREMRYGNNEYLWVNDLTPKLIMHPINTDFVGQDVSDMEDPNGLKIFVEMVNIVKNRGKGFVEYQWRLSEESAPKDKISYVQGFEPWGWVVGTGIYTDDVDAIYHSMVIRSVFMVLMITLFLLVAVIFIARMFINSTDNLKNVMESVVSKNDLTLRTKITGKNEFGAMGSAFNGMLSTFENIIFEVSESVNRVASATEQLMVISRQTSNSMQQQNMELDRVAMAMDNMSNSVQEVSNNTGDTVDTTEQAHNEAEHGHGIVETTKSSINVLASGVESAASVINGLESDSANIGTILDVIRGIAEQTNLLALNAAIEAARAGEQGRGFAVVADEVRTLAKRTQDSIEEIETMIKRLQSGAGNAVTAMDDGRKMASTSVEQIMKVADSLTKINEMISLIKEKSVTIAATSDSQTGIAIEMEKNIVNINALSKDTLSGAQETSEACSDLAKLAENLREVTRKFRVK